MTKFFCADCGQPYRDDGLCLIIINNRLDEMRPYCPFCTTHGRFELRTCDELIYDEDRFEPEYFGDHNQFVCFVEK